MKKAKGRLAGEKSIQIIELPALQEAGRTPTLQQMQSPMMGPLASHPERTPYSPNGRYPVSDTLLDYGESVNPYS